MRRTVRLDVQMNSVLVLYAHPSPELSRANRILRQAIEGTQGVTLHDLYESYPDFFVDVAREQQMLLQHRVIVFQHPFYWYSCPPLLKEWMDTVLEHGFAYGEGGDKLRGKHFVQAITTAGPETRYQYAGLNHFTIAELLRPFEQSAHLCGLITHAPFVTYAVRGLANEQLAQRATEYRALITDLVEGIFPPEANTFSQA